MKSRRKTTEEKSRGQKRSARASDHAQAPGRQANRNRVIAQMEKRRKTIDTDACYSREGEGGTRSNPTMERNRSRYMCHQKSTLPEDKHDWREEKMPSGGKTDLVRRVSDTKSWTTVGPARERGGISLDTPERVEKAWGGGGGAAGVDSPN